MAESGENVSGKIKEVIKNLDQKHGLEPEDEVFHSFEYKSPKDKKAAAKYFQRAAQERVDEETAKRMAEHELGHALGDKKTGKYILRANSRIINPSYQIIGRRSPQELKRIFESGGGYLSEGDKQQLEIIDQELKNFKKWWQFWKK